MKHTFNEIMTSITAGIFLLTAIWYMGAHSNASAIAAVGAAMATLYYAIMAIDDILKQMKRDRKRGEKRCSITNPNAKN